VAQSATAGRGFMLLTAVLEFFAGAFEEAPFAVGETILTLFVDFFQDCIEPGFVGFELFLVGLRIDDAQFRLGFHAFPQAWARKEFFEPKPPLVINESKRSAA
jgi:hypothetical protein